MLNYLQNTLPILADQDLKHSEFANPASRIENKSQDVRQLEMKYQQNRSDGIQNSDWRRKGSKQHMTYYNWANSSWAKKPIEEIWVPLTYQSLPSGAAECHCRASKKQKKLITPADTSGSEIKRRATHCGKGRSLRPCSCQAAFTVSCLQF